MEDQGLFSPCCRNGDFLSRTRFPKPYLRLFLAPPNISHSFSHPFSGFTFLITYFIRNVSSFLLFAAYIDGTSELKSRSALSRSSPSPSLTRLVPTPLSMKNAFRA
ncbi:hypothetical protein GBA52_015464 [Prunus armeniaca]|nr:hypothetical protein GBA52_015464 [Prunus armeniaca]